MTKVSVIITTFNSMRFFPETLASVLRQTFSEIEVIVVDDGSSDGISDWITSVEDSRIIFHSQSNQGVSSARNTGISLARGEYIAFLDGDDVWVPTKVERQVKVLDLHEEVGLVHTWLALMDEGSRLTGRVMKPHSEGEIWQEIVESNMIACSSVMVRRACLDIAGTFDSTLIVAEDWDLWIRVAASYRISVVRALLVQYRIHPSSKSKRYPEMVEDFRKIIERAFQSVPYEYLPIRSRSYGRVNLCIAWKCIQAKEPDFEKAKFFCQQALSHYPSLRLSREFLSFSIASSMMQIMGMDSYVWCLSLFNTMRKIFSRTSVLWEHVTFVS
ncbi:glycosyltransferase [Acaryochloris marina]|uniref:glycosyltransferase family 2 protein n=1 Tax=Acaryochloris marina TaxID=155978 RepID=UPI001BB0CA7A|nr:glycosyltransferase [Acaryochloris marina]QUY44736.1 glycosyltransferase [Acaryochloris marina S15]